MLLPFVLAGTLAFVCSPLVGWLAARTHLPRSLFAVGVSALLFAIDRWIGCRSAAGGRSEGACHRPGWTVESLARLLIGNETVHILGEDMNAAAIGEALVSGIRDWLGTGRQIGNTRNLRLRFDFRAPSDIDPVLLFSYRRPRIGGGLFSLVPPKHRP
jgi:hypothetical protein